MRPRKSARNARHFVLRRFARLTGRAAGAPFHGPTRGARSEVGRLASTAALQAARAPRETHGASAPACYRRRALRWRSPMSSTAHAVPAPGHALGSGVNRGDAMGAMGAMGRKAGQSGGRPAHARGEHTPGAASAGALGNRPGNCRLHRSQAKTRGSVASGRGSPGAV